MKSGDVGNLIIVERGEYNMRKLWNEYLVYLVHRYGLIKEFKHYHKLFDVLHNVDFRYEIARDENREADGLSLRDGFPITSFADRDKVNEFYGQYASVFEVLLALAIRVDAEYIGDPMEEHPEKFFMEMIKNLELDQFKDPYCIGDKPFKILDDWMDRRFEKNGDGSPFPVYHDHRDQRKIEIWDQMISYINETYY